MEMLSAISSVIIISQNKYFSLGFKNIAEEFLSQKLIYLNETTCDLTISRENINSETFVIHGFSSPRDFSDLELLTTYFHVDRIFVVISNPTIAIISLICGLGIRKILSDIDCINDFRQAITVASDDEYISPVLLSVIKKSGGHGIPKIKEFTKMERYVFASLLKGISMKSIAAEKNITLKTVFNHRRAASKKISIKNPSGLFL